MIEINEGGRLAVSSVVKKTDQLSQAVGTPLSGSRENSTSANVVSLPSADISFASKQTRNDHLTTTATTIRAANKVMDDVAQLIGEKREEVIVYEKQYPPFQNQSSEKVEFLNSIAALKKQVDALTLVPDNKELASIISENDDQSSERKSFDFPVRPQQVHSGQTGLNIASVNSNATDSEIKQFGRDLATASQTLDSRRAGLAEDAKTISRELSVNEKSIGKEMLESDQDASQKSEEVKKDLVALPGESLGNEQGRKFFESLMVELYR